MTAADGVVALDPGVAEHRRAAADLHARLLGDSFVVRLGDAFMTELYYGRLVRDGSIRCDLYRRAGAFVAFIACTEEPATFLARGLRRHAAPLAWVLARALARHPARARVVASVAGLTGRRAGSPPAGRAGEILSLGVLPEHRHAVDAASGLRISALLLERALGRFAARGLDVAQALVRRDNAPALLLYAAYGAVAEPSPWGDGGVRLSIPLRAAATAAGDPR